MPAIKLDVALLHVNESDEKGNTLIFGPDPFFDDLFARAASNTFVSTEKLVDSGIADETTQVMKNLEAVLIESGMSFKDVVKTTIFLKSMDDFALVNSEYGKSFEGSTPPARETVEVSKLPLNVNVEISCIAIKK